VAESLRNKIQIDFEARESARLNLAKRKEIQKMKGRTVGNQMKFVFTIDKKFDEENNTYCS
jgi:hypothetical protein